MNTITFESLPQAVTALTKEVGELKQILLSKNTEPRTETDRWFNLNELCDYLPDKPKKATVYAWVWAQTIPVHKGGKKLRFLKSEIDTWLKSGRKKTLAEINAEAQTYLSNKKKS